MNQLRRLKYDEKFSAVPDLNTFFYWQKDEAVADNLCVMSEEEEGDCAVWEVIQFNSDIVSTCVLHYQLWVAQFLT